MSKGQVYLVGAGSGRLSDLTYRAKYALQAADLVYYDRLVNSNLLHLTRPDCQLIDVGKNPYQKQTPQDKIEEAMIQSAKQGRTVVRLKGGDPYVFGRGAEEAASLKKAKIPFTVVSGLSSALTGPAYAGIPVTVRKEARSFHVFTSHTAEGVRDFPWSALVELEGSLIFMMGMKQLGRITQSLIEAGKDPNTPAAVIQWASRYKQRTVTAPLCQLADLSHQAGLSSPAIILVGEVVDWRDDLLIFEDLPFFGRQLAVSHLTDEQDILAAEEKGFEILFYQEEVVGQLADRPVEAFDQLTVYIPSQAALVGAIHSFSKSSSKISRIYCPDNLFHQVQDAFPTVKLKVGCLDNILKGETDEASDCFN